MIALAGTMTLLRQLASPEGQAVLSDAADALDARPKQAERIAELEAAAAELRATVAAQAERIRQLEAAAADPGLHLVRAGDTLYSLARHYGTTVTDLKAWNGLTSNTIVVGTTLRVRAPR